MTSFRKIKKILTSEDMELWNEIVRTIEPLKRDCQKSLPGLKEKTRIDKKSRTEDNFVKTSHALENEKKNLSDFSFSLSNSFNPDQTSLEKPPARAIPVFQAATRQPVVKTEQMDPYTAKKISKGKIIIDSQLDLHGYTQKDAYRMLYGYIEKAYHDRKKIILIITGKGKMGHGVLRENIPKWLRQSVFNQMVSSFGDARSPHGGTGALYVRIRRKLIS